MYEKGNGEKKSNDPLKKRSSVILAGKKIILINNAGKNNKTS